MKSMTKSSGKTGQQGAAAVEFALIASFFLFLLLGIVEFGRFLYLYNSVQEVTRCAARQAVVQWTNQVAGIQRACIFREGSTGDVSLPAAPEVTNTNVRIRFINASLADASPLPISAEDNIAACIDATRVNSCIRYVEASIQDSSGNPISYQPMIGLFQYMGIDIPSSITRMPVESLGFR